MATTVRVSYKGNWRSVPNSPREADHLQWYKGADIPMRSWMEPHGRFQEIAQWCKQTFDIHHFKMFEDSVWFIDEQDAMVCRLRWS